MRKVIAGAAALCLASSVAFAQVVAPTTDTARRPTQGLNVYLITIGEGAQYWEKYGHNMVWFHDPAAGIDEAYNWGSFDFTAPGFLGRILVGDALYSVEVHRGGDVVYAYQQADRRIVLQRLNLSAEQARSAYEYARKNAQPENKFYRYDYFLDNCSTRVRDLIDLAVGGQLKAATHTKGVPWTYRTETLRSLDDMTLTQFGVNVALGQPADRRITVWEDMFLPRRVQDAIRELRVRDAAGALVPLVAEERVVYESRSHREREDVPSLRLPYMVVGLLLAVELLAVGLVGERSGIVDKIFRIEVILWAALTGFLGLVVLLAWLLTQHVFWFRNENLLLVNPLLLWLALLVPLSMRRVRWTRAAAIVAVVVALMSAVALILKGFPATQNNLPLVLLFLPPQFTVAYGLWRRTSVRADSAPAE